VRGSKPGEDQDLGRADPERRARQRSALARRGSRARGEAWRSPERKDAHQAFVRVEELDPATLLGCMERVGPEGGGGDDASDAPNRSKARGGRS
jgi:hypothetical protein